MSLTRALRLGLRREVLILLPVALFILTLLAAFTLWLYRSAVLDLAEERRAEALVAAERLAAAVSSDGLKSAANFDRLAPQAARLALLTRKGQPILEVGSTSLGDQLAPFRGLDLSHPQVVGPGGLLPDVVSAVAPAVGKLRSHYVRVDLRADKLADELDRVETLTWLVIAIPAILFLVVVLSMRSLMVPYETMLERARQARPDDAEDRDEMDFLVGTFERALSALSESPEDGVKADIAALERTLGPSLESGLLLLDRHARVISLNPVGALMLGRPPSQPGTALDQALRKHAELLAVVQEVVDSGNSIHRREVRVALEDEPRTLGLTAHALRRDDGHVRGYLVLFADLTEARRRAEEEQLATSLTQVGELAAGVAHEMRNSLATLKGYLRLVEKAPDEESITDYLSEINRESDHLQRVLEDFLSFARPGTRRLETLDLTSIAGRAAADPALEGLEVKVEFDRHLDADIKGDPQLLERAVRNLLHNAAEAERQSGGSGPLRVNVRSGPSGVTLLVEDRGPGIPEEVRQRLFRPFATGRSDGVGLGLALARRIVDMHGGRLTLEARPLGGTRAVMEFPAPQAGGLEAGSGARVLPSNR
jgi:signal transduction histidine kinase